MNSGNINEQLKEYRKLACKTQKEVADAIGIDKSTYAHYELGRRVPNIKTWMKLAEVLNMPTFPAQIHIEYPKDLVGKLKNYLKEFGRPTNDYKENINRVNNINNLLNELFEFRNDAMNIDDLSIEVLMNPYVSKPYTIINVTFDLASEMLIERALKCESELLNYKFE